MDQIKIIEDPQLIKCLLDETRRKMIIEMMKEPKTLSQMAEKLGKTPATIHFHISKLSKVGIVKLVETKTVNNNLVEKYYQANLPAPLLFGFNSANHRGPVPPKNYSQPNIKLALAETDVKSAMADLNLSIIPERNKIFAENLNEILSGFSLYSVEIFRNLCQQLNVNLPTNCSDRIEAALAALPTLTLIKLFDDPKLVSILNDMVQSIKKT
jgi:DNA-binding transcriptional ArsR family regulator